MGKRVGEGNRQSQAMATNHFLQIISTSLPTSQFLHYSNTVGIMSLPSILCHLLLINIKMQLQHNFDGHQDNCNIRIESLRSVYVLNSHVTQDLTSTFTMRDGGEFKISVNVRRWHFRENLFQDLCSCISSLLANAWMVMPFVYIYILRRSDPSDLQSTVI